MPTTNSSLASAGLCLLVGAMGCAVKYEGGSIDGEGGSAGDIGAGGAPPVAMGGGGLTSFPLPTGGTGAVPMMTGGSPPVGAGGQPTVPMGGSGGAPPVVAPNRDYEQLFAPELVPEFFITIPPTSITALNADATVYQPGTFQYGDTVVENVGVRLKGRASFRTLDEKAGLKVKFNEYVSGRTFMGLRRLTLNNMVQDPTKVHECLGYRLFRAAGVDASLCNHARVYVNGEFFGIYSNVETIDRTFLEARFQPAPGNLYDMTNDTYDVDFDRSLEQGGFLQGPQPPVETLFELETNTSVPDTSDLTRLIDTVSYASDATFVAEVEAVMDLDHVLRNAAVQAIIADWDGFFGAHNNFKVYHELARDRFILVPWGIDQTFGLMGDSLSKLDYAIDASNSERDRALVFRRCLADAACVARYHDALRAALAVWDSLPLADEANAMEARIAPSLAEPSREEHTLAEHQAAMVDLHTFLAQRSAIVQGQL